MKKSKIKSSGQVYTPHFIVNIMLDMLGYYGDNILKKHIIDNSCGDGAFLIEIVKRYCTEFYKKYGKDENSKEKLKEDLEKYIHGIEIQQEEKEKCIFNLNCEIKLFGLSNVKWDIICADALSVDNYNGKMDFVVGNPPYVRVHNLGENYEKVRKYKFAKNGMTDLYIVFFEIGFNMLNKGGKMCLITPNSFLTSKAGIELRKYILKNRNLKAIIDLGHFQPFKGIITYTVITIFDTEKEYDKIAYYEYDEKRKKPLKIGDLSYSDVFIDGKIYFLTMKNLHLLKKIEVYNKKNKPQFEVKNGFATLADKIFIRKNFDFEEGLIRVLKASTGEWYKCIFPYDNEGNPISLEQLRQNSKLYNYLLQHKKKLEKRDIKDKSQWFLFGRSQGIKDVYKDKVAINNVIKDIDDTKLIKVPAGSGVFGGLYIVGLQIEVIEKIIKTNDFLEYVKSLKKYKNSGYYTFSSDDLKKFLNYKLNNYE